MPPQPDQGLHANRKNSIPWLSHSNGPRCFSRTNILNGTVPCAFGSDQTMEVCVSGEQLDKPLTHPQKWHKAGRILRVPKVVILSSLPFWTLWWQSCYFYGPRDVIGIDLQTNEIGNYYYFDQWNDNTAVPNESDPATFKSTFDKSLNPGDLSTIFNTRWVCQLNCDSPGACAACDAIPADMINTCLNPPSERFSRIVGTCVNPIYSAHQAYMAAFQEAQITLESDPIDPIYCIIPDWLPTDLHQIRNGALHQQEEKLNPSHGGAPNKQPCDVTDVIPCYTYTNVCWAPAYPDINDSRNDSDFVTPAVPWFSSLDPGFGTNVLHLFVGHPCLKFSPSNVTWDFQAWPLSPEVQYLFGAIFQGSYLGDSVPSFSGRRPVWRDFGFNYGYTINGGITVDNVAGPAGVYGHYKEKITPSVGQHKANFYNFRGYGIKLTTYTDPWEFNWVLGAIFADQENTCPTTQFFDGYENFSDFAQFYDSIDTSVKDCEDDGANPAHLKYGETANNFPLTPDLREAIDGFYPRIVERVDAYYGSIADGTRAEFQDVMTDNGLSVADIDYNVELIDSLPKDADAIVGIVRKYFSTHL